MALNCAPKNGKCYTVYLTVILKNEKGAGVWLEEEERMPRLFTPTATKGSL